MRNDSGDRETDPGTDSLDRLIEQGRWPEPEALRLARLQRHWTGLSEQRRRRVRRIRVAAVAAGLLLAAGFGLWWLPSAPPGRHVAPAPDRFPVPDLPPAPQFANQPVDGSLPTADRDAPGRKPTAYERFALGIVMARQERANQSRGEDLLGQTVETLLTTPEAEIHELARPLLSRRSFYEEQLMQSIPAAQGEVQIARLRLLGVIGGPRSVPLLVKLSQSEATRFVALESLSKVADPATLAKIARSESDFEFQTNLLSAVLARTDPVSLNMYLAAVRDHRTREAALRAFDQSANPPVDLLFDVLSGPESEQRLVASRLLARINRPDVVARLTELAHHPVARQPALAALLSSEHPQAQWFLSEAWQHPDLRSAIQLAQLERQMAALQRSPFPVPEIN